MSDGPPVDWANYRPPPDGRRCRSHNPAVERARYSAWRRGNGIDPPYPVRCILAIDHKGPHTSWQLDWAKHDGTGEPFRPPMGQKGRARV